MYIGIYPETANCLGTPDYYAPQDYCPSPQTITPPTLDYCPPACVENAPTSRTQHRKYWSRTHMRQLDIRHDDGHSYA